MRVLAVSYMLPPMLYPQAIQVGRLLEWSGVELTTVSGLLQAGNPPGSHNLTSSTRIIRRIQLPHRAPLQGLAHRLAMRLLPFYARTPDEFVGWARRAAVAAAETLRTDGIELLASFGEPMSDHLVCLELKRSFGLPWLAHFSDPWSDNPFRSFQPLANSRNRRLEAQVIEAADCLVFTSEETRQLVMAKYPAVYLNKSFVLPHSYDPADFAQAPPRQSRSSLVIRYLGSFYGHRTPFPLFSSLLRLSRSHPQLLEGVRVELVGSMPGWMRLHHALDRLPPGLLQIRDPVPYRRSLELMRDADLLLVIDAPAKSSVFLPSKLADYIGAGRPIFGIVPPGASQRVITQLGGRTANPSNPMAIDAGLLAAIAEAKSSQMPEAWGDPSIRASFSIAKIAKDFRNVLAWCIENVRS